ncbi:MAG: cytochrome c [Burkholderiaceae bacterium]|nr:cytochrome c [Burkholderiaceae bacterium]
MKTIWKGMLFAGLLASSVASSLVSSPALAEDLDGATLFRKRCSACHQPDGQGIPGAFPALAGNAFVQGDGDAVASVLLSGRGGMPNFSGQLADRDIAAVLSFVRSSWGNQAPPLSAEQVAALRARLHANAYDPAPPGGGRGH